MIIIFMILYLVKIAGGFLALPLVKVYGGSVTGRKEIQVITQRWPSGWPVLYDAEKVWSFLLSTVFSKPPLSHSFLAHLSTKCSGWAIVTGLCPSSVVVRRALSVVHKLFYLNIFSSETTYWTLTKLHRNDPWVVPYQSCSNGSDWLHK